MWHVPTQVPTIEADFNVSTAGVNVVLTGKSGTVDFGGGELTGAGAEDAFLVKFGPNQIPIPTLSEWGLLALTGIICFYAVVIIRRKKQAGTG